MLQEKQFQFILDQLYQVWLNDFHRFVYFLELSNKILSIIKSIKKKICELINESIDKVAIFSKPSAMIDVHIPYTWFTSWLNHNLHHPQTYHWSEEQRKHNTRKINNCLTSMNNENKRQQSEIIQFCMRYLIELPRKSNQKWWSEISIAVWRYHVELAHLVLRWSEQYSHSMQDWWMSLMADKRVIWDKPTNELWISVNNTLLHIMFLSWSSAFRFDV